MDESRSNSKAPFRKSDLFLVIFLIITLLLASAAFDLLFGQPHKKYAKPNVGTQRAAYLRIYDILGREVQTLFNSEITEGQHEIDFNASGLPSGIYFYQLQVNGRIINSKKMVLLK